MFTVNCKSTSVVNELDCTSSSLIPAQGQCSYLFNRLGRVNGSSTNSKTCKTRRQNGRVSLTDFKCFHCPFGFNKKNTKQRNGVFVKFQNGLLEIFCRPFPLINFRVLRERSFDETLE